MGFLIFPANSHNQNKVFLAERQCYLRCQIMSLILHMKYLALKQKHRMEHQRNRLTELSDNENIKHKLMKK